MPDIAQSGYRGRAVGPQSLIDQFVMRDVIFTRISLCYDPIYCSFLSHCKAAPCFPISSLKIPSPSRRACCCRAAPANKSHRNFRNFPQTRAGCRPSDRQAVFQRNGCVRFCRQIFPLALILYFINTGRNRCLRKCGDVANVI